MLCSPSRLPPDLRRTMPPDPLPSGVARQRLLLGAAHVAACELLLRDRLARVSSLVRAERVRVMGLDATPPCGGAWRPISRPTSDYVSSGGDDGRRYIESHFYFDPPGDKVHSALTLHLPLLDVSLSIPLPNALPTTVLRGLAVPLIADAAKRLRDGQEGTPLLLVAQIMATR